MSGEELLAGRYRLAGELGRGGMGTVWRARDETLNREVAIKELILPRETTEERREMAVRRALREARAAARLRHPGIITVHDVILADGRPWIVTELLSGRSLDKILEQEGPLEPRRAAALGIEMLDALRTAHDRGVLHRDVKPANVFLRDDGRAVLTDFGIASLAGDAPLTRPGALIGSPSFMAPERIRGEPSGPPSDLWSLGATLYALVEGRVPFGGSTPMAVLATVLADDPAPPQLAGPLSGLLLRLLTKDPAARPTAAQTSHDLAELTEPRDTAERAEAPGRVESTGPVPVRRSRRTVAIALTALACLVAAAVTGFTLVPHARSGRPRASASGHPTGRPTPFASALPVCGLISVARMNRLVPQAGLGGDAGSAPPYFDWEVHHEVESCQWNERSSIEDGHTAAIMTRPIRVGSPDPVKPARAEFARLRTAPPTSVSSPPRPLAGAGDEAFAYDRITGEEQARDYYAIVILRTRNMLTEVRYEWYKRGGAPPPGGLAPLRAGAAQLSQWIDAALRAGRPVDTP
ncbi:MAG: Serine/threonine protein kinase [Actinoallomurus sp.]|jgi:hypothetical protein|nr:Serine/threonine protein kinase [Actinoallomurus sp.]